MAGRVGDVAVFAAVLLLVCPFPCHASRRDTPVKEPEGCVSVKTPYRRYQDVKVATCGLAQDLEKSTQDLQAQVVTLETATNTSLDDQGEKIEDLREDVDFLQGKTNFVTRFTANIRVNGATEFELRPFCEIYTYSEAMVFARFIFDVENPNPHWVHIACEAPQECPTTFWKIREGCYRPNDPLRDDRDVSPLDRCFYDPIPLNETCDRYVYLGYQGYSDNVLNQFWNHTYGGGPSQMAMEG